MTATTQMTTEASRRRSLPTPDEARRAVYIDFEGTALDPPSLLGVLIEDEFVQYVFEPELFPAAEAKSIEHGGTCVVTSPDALFGALRRRLESEDRRVFAWSTHEDTAITALVDDPDDQRYWRHIVENAIPIARPWRRRHHRGVAFETLKRGRPSRNPLAGYLELVGYPVAWVHGPNNTAQRIRHLRDALGKRGTYAALTTVQKNKWANLLSHNRHDCVGMRAVMERVALDRP